jgi:hypothetical protein
MMWVNAKGKIPEGWGIMDGVANSVGNGGSGIAMVSGSDKYFARACENDIDTGAKATGVAVSNTWLVIGSGPNAETALTRARRDWPDATTIATNSAALLLRPDYYFISDQTACVRWAVVATAYQQLGTKLVTLARQTDALKNRGLEAFDIFVDGPDFCYSGIFCVLWAARQAERVCLVGHDGYRSTPDKLFVDYFDGRLGSAQFARQTRDLIAPRLTAIAKAFPRVEFIQYMQPFGYQIDAPNWTVRP